VTLIGISTFVSADEGGLGLAEDRAEASIARRDRIIEGSPQNAVTAIPILPWVPAPAP
jgi:catabolite regulation protein CreA